MCGFVGFLDFTGEASADALHTRARAMADTLAHRGPDDGGIWEDPTAGVALAHRRLSIIDLSQLGRQPMHSADGEWVLIYNGEVYNFAALRQELSGLGYSFRGGSDTEVMLAAFSAWGVSLAVTRFQGMFAFAAWHRPSRRLYLGRDRLGIKPLYLGWGRGVFAFGSELKALRAHPGMDGPINRDAVALFLRHAYVPAPYAIYENTYKLLPGTVLELDPKSAADAGGFQPFAGQGAFSPQRFWSLQEVYAAGEQQRGEAEALDGLTTCLREAVGRRLVADVPLGAFLSGGIDSSLVVALMQEQSTRPVQTFTIGFHEAAFNEATHAAAVAAHLGTEHHELYLSAQEARDVIPLLPRYYDEPFADSSQIPTYLVCRTARAKVTVALSGDGGDELFYGYDRYPRAAAHWARRGRTPAPVRAALGGLSAVLPHRPGADRLIRAGRMFRAPDFAGFYRQLMSIEQKPLSLLVAGDEPPTAFSRAQDFPPQTGIERMMTYLDLCTYLPDDILTKVDRASMAVGLEARVPLLDHEVVAYAAGLPHAMKTRDGVAKWALRQVLYRYVPQTLIDRPKMGFGIPLDAWIKGPLRGWAEDLLAPTRLKEEGVFRPEAVAGRWRDYLKADGRGGSLIWQLLVFQDWLASVRG